MSLYDMFNSRRSRTRNSVPQETQEPERGNLIDEKSASPIAIIYRSELDYLSRCVLDYPNIETGGQLFGFWTSQGAPVVLYAIGPGYNANHQPTFFNQDTEYLSTVGNELLSRYGLCHIGEWHSHHQLGLARPSGHDARTMFHGLQSIPQRRLLLCICNYERGCSTVNPYTFHENNLREYVDAIWQVIDIDSPFRKLADRELASMLIHPRTLVPRHGNNRTVETHIGDGPKNLIRFDKDYWLINNDNVSTMKRMAALTQELFAPGTVAVQANDKGIVQLHIEDKNLDIRFSENFPDEGPQVYVKEMLMDLPLVWHVPVSDQDIYKSYKEWIEQLVNRANR